MKLSKEEVKAKSQLDSKESQIKCLKDSHTALENRITELEIALDKQSGIVSDKDELIKDLKTEVKTLKDSLETSNKKVNERVSEPNCYQTQFVFQTQNTCIVL